MEHEICMADTAFHWSNKEDNGNHVAPPKRLEHTFNSRPTVYMTYPLRNKQSNGCMQCADIQSNQLG